MVPIKKRAGVTPYIFPSSLALLSSLISCRFYLLEQRTISGVDILEMTWKEGTVLTTATFQAYRTLTISVYSQQSFLSNSKRLRTDNPEEMPLKGGIVALCPYQGHLSGVCTVSKRSYLTVHRISSTRIF